MRELIVHEYPISIKITDRQGKSEMRTAIIREVLDGVSNLFLLDIKLWLEAHIREEWSGFPVFVLYHGGSQFPLRASICAHGCTNITLINLDRGEG